MPPASRILNFAVAEACYPAQPRNRGSSGTSKKNTKKPYSNGSTSPASTSSSLNATSSVTTASSSSPSASSSTSDDERCTCRVSNCNKSYNRVYDLLRHLASKTHRTAMANADATAILAAGVPAAYLPRAQQLLGRQNKCSVCDRVFSRRDALRRHLAEAGHRLKEEVDDDVVCLPSAPVPAAAAVAPPAVVPPPGYQWALVPTPAPAPTPVVVDPFMFGFDLALGFDPTSVFTAPLPVVEPPVAPLLVDFDDFVFVDGIFASEPALPEPAPAPAQPSLFEETMAMWFGGASNGQ